MSVAIHAAAVILVLTLTLSDGIVERPRLTRTMVLLLPPPMIHAANTAFVAAVQPTRTMERIAPRQFRAPVSHSATAHIRESVTMPAFQTPLLDVARPLLPAAEIAHLAVAAAPPLRTDNLAPLAALAPVSAASPIVVSQSSGFEQIAVETPRHPRAALLVGGEFEDATMILPVPSHSVNTAHALPVTRTVEILSKPRPAFTEEARRQHIEGEVLLQVMFAASGEVSVLRTVRGLGHGLDENAIAAAEGIRFRPAERSGIAADSIAVVHIVFQLAY